MTARYSHVASSYLIPIHNGKTVLLRRRNTGFFDGHYGLVAGHVDEGETALQAMIREAKEEAGLDINPLDLTLSHIMHRQAAEDTRIDFFWTIAKGPLPVKIMEPEKCDDLNWFPLDNLPDNTIPYIKQALNSLSSVIFYSEHGWQDK